MAPIALGLGLNLATLSTGVGISLYFDSVNGNDANNGLSAATAKQSPAAYGALPTSGTIGFARGSSWRETVTLPDGVNAVAYGTGKMPIFDAADIAGTWTKTVGYTNVWQQTWTHEYYAGKSYLSAWADGVRLRWRASLALLDANADSFYAATPSGTSTTVYIYAVADPNSDGKIYEISKRLYGMKTGVGSVVRGIHTKRQVHHNGSLELGQNARAYSCLTEDGCVHNMFLAAGAVAYDCIAWKADWPDRSTITMFVAYTDNGDGKGFRFERCIAVQDPDKITTAMLGFYCHTDAGAGHNWDDAQFVDCATYGVYDGISAANCDALTIQRPHSAATRVGIRSRVSGTVAVTDPWVHCVSGIAVNADCAFIQQDNTGAGVVEGVRFYSEDSNSAGSVIATGGTGAIEAKRNVIVGDTITSALAGFGNASGNPLNVHHNLIVGLNRAYNALGTSDWTGDYNDIFPSTTDVRYGGTTYSSFTSYASANPTLDLHTVTTDPGLIDPANGNFNGTNIPMGMGLERPGISYTAIPSDVAIAAM